MDLITNKSSSSMMMNQSFNDKRAKQQFQTFPVFDGNMKRTEIQQDPQFKRIERTPSDEILLTELALDDKEFEIFDITSIIKVAERQDVNVFGRFKCYQDKSSLDFYIEINESTPINSFTKNTLLNLLDLAEKQGAKRVIAAFRQELNDIQKQVKQFIFVGFKALNSEELQQLSMTETHILLKYDIADELNDDEEDLDAQI